MLIYRLIVYPKNLENKEFDEKNTIAINYIVSKFILLACKQHEKCP